MYNRKESFEDYLEKILELTESGANIRAIDLANAMKYSKASVSIALKKLKANELVEIEAKSGHISLTEKGKNIAISTLEKHHLLKQMLLHIGVDEITSDEDACKIEHLLSEKTYEKLKIYINKNK